MGFDQDNVEDANPWGCEVSGDPKLELASVGSFDEIDLRLVTYLGGLRGWKQIL